MTKLLSACFLIAATLAMVGCGANDTQQQVDTANASLHRTREIRVSLLADGIWLGDGVQTSAIADKTPAQLAEIDELLREFVTCGNNVIGTGSRGDVNYPEHDLRVMEASVADASKLREAIRNADVGSSDVAHRPAHKRRKHLEDE